MTKDEIADVTRLTLGDRIRAAVKAVLEQVIEEEMTEHVGARHREKTDARMGERNGSYTHGLITPVGKIEQLRVPRDREGTFTTEVFEKYHRATGEVEDAVLELLSTCRSAKQGLALTWFAGATWRRAAGL